MTTYASYSFPDASGLSNMTALQAILKEYYGPQQVKVLVYRRNKWLAMVHKEEDWAGEVVPIPTVWANPQGASRTFARALAQQTASAAARFVMQWTQDYQMVTITNLVQLASRNDAGAFLKAVQREMNGGLKNSENRWAGALFRSSTATIGRGTITAGAITLSDPMAVTQFEYGQCLEAAATDGGTALGGPNYGFVCAVDRTNGVVYVATTFTVGMTQASAGTPGSWTGTMYFRTAGDNNLSINGFADWLTTSNVASNDAFNSVNRSVDQTRLSGVKWNGSNQSIEEALVDAAALSAREDGNPELALTNHTSFAALSKALGAKREYVNYEHDEVPGVGFSGLRIHGADEEINIFADRNCPGRLCYGIDPDSWTLGSMKPLPHILTELDGLQELRDPNNDATQIRIGGYGIMACDAPGHNFVAQLQI
jgi:hypothetical protein